MTLGLFQTSDTATGEVSPHNSNVSSRFACFGAFRMDLQRQQLYRGGSRIKLPGKVCDVLLILLERPGEVVTRENMRIRLWPADTHVNYDANVNTTVNKLRQILGDSPEQPAYVETIPRRGYSFVARVEFTDELLAPVAPGSADVAVLRSRAPTKARDASGTPPDRSRIWFTAAVVVLVISAVLLGAAITLYSYRAV